MSKTELQTNQLQFVRPELGENFSTEFTGFALFIAGVLMFVNLHLASSVSWVGKMTGWTAPIVALTLVIVGAVVMLGNRAGYWSAEALIGAEFVLLGLQAGTFVRLRDNFDWQVLANGAHGGLIGWTVGGILTAWFGHAMALVLVGIMLGAGIVLLVRYTPLVYLAVYVARLTPIVAVLGRYWLRVPFFSWPRRRVDRAGRYGEDVRYGGASLIHNENYVAAGPIEEWDEIGRVSTWQEAAQGRRNQVHGRLDKNRLRPAHILEALPPLDLLSEDAGVYCGTDVRGMERLIEQTLGDFNVPVRVVHVESGPTVTQFGVEPQYLERSGKRRKVRVNRIANLADDLALALAAPSVRIEAPVPGRPYVGIEVPNAEKTIVSLRGILESASMQRRDGLLVGLGRDTAGAPVAMDLTRAPHLLIAGATGSGKSVCINTIITSLLMQHGPESLRFVMVDPKMVELPGYNGIPHLTGKVITDVEQVMGALTWLLLQMDDRYRLFQEAGVRNIDGYNAMVRKRRGRNAPDPLPYLVLIVDELADLMMTAPEDVERQICRLASMARATGIHLILATQRPSTDVVTGLIKANIPTRIAFAVSSQVDSRVILDTPGADRLLGQGDMLLMRSDASKLFRLQGCYVSDDEINRVVGFWKSQAGEEQSVVPPWNGLLDQMDEEDELILDAIDVVRSMETCSTSMLQRKLRVGYPKAARIMEELEARSVVGPDQGGGQGRVVLLKAEDGSEEEDDLLVEELV